MTSSMEVRKTPRERRFRIALLILCAIGAGAATRRIVALSTTPLAGGSTLATLDAHFAAKAGVMLLHIVPSLLFVLLLPLQFISSLRARHPRWHRWTGRVLVVSLGVVVGVSALSMSAQPVGGLAESTAVIFFGCFFLFALGKAWWHIRHGRVERHRQWAIRVAAIALGVATTRPIMAVFFATSRVTGLTPQQFFGPAMWLGFVSTYLAAEIWIDYTRPRTAVIHDEAMVSVQKTS
jgi:hypothetical protein